MRRALAGLALLCAGGLASAGCSASDPTGGLGDSLFVEALVDAQLAAERAAETGEPPDSLEAAALARHGLDTTAFRRALRRLARDPEAYSALTDSAIDRLSQARTP